MRFAIGMLVVVGCGGAAQYGSFVVGRVQAQAAIAGNAAKKLSEEFPPDRHAIQLPDGAAEAFGRSFAAELRKVGFAVKQSATPSSAGELQVRYVVDELKGTDLLRVTLYVQRRRLSRAYAERSGALYPAGPWSIASEPIGGRHGS